MGAIKGDFIVSFLSYYFLLFGTGMAQIYLPTPYFYLVS